MDYKIHFRHELGEDLLNPGFGELSVEYRGKTYEISYITVNEAQALLEQFRERGLNDDGSFLVGPNPNLVLLRDETRESIDAAVREFLEFFD